MSDDAGSPAAAVTPTRLQALGSSVARIFSDTLVATTHAGELTYEVPADRLLEVATSFRDHVDLQFDMCMDVCGVDYLEHGRVEWKTETATSSGFSRGVARHNGHPAPIAPGEIHSNADIGAATDRPVDLATGGRRFAAVYHLLSIALNHRVRLRVFCPDDTQPMVDSVTGIWAGVDWFEREAFDLFGILFKGHPDLRRLLTDYGFIGHPFRKDFPLSGNVEVRYDPEKGRVVYQPVTIEPRILVPKVIRHDNRYDPALTNAPVGPAASTAVSGKPNG
jgi:NADH-quinone oxidoreductase subunit C